jgi:hypothetical protein
VDGFETPGNSEGPVATTLTVTDGTLSSTTSFGVNAFFLWFLLCVMSRHASFEYLYVQSTSNTPFFRSFFKVTHQYGNYPRHAQLMDYLSNYPRHKNTHQSIAANLLKYHLFDFFSHKASARLHETRRPPNPNEAQRAFLQNIMPSEVDTDFQKIMQARRKENGVEERCLFHYSVTFILPLSEAT